MNLKKVISGGQTGADRTGLECARAMGLETGGWAPAGWRTDDGADPSLRGFGLVQHESPTYPPRTAWNVHDSDATVWFGRTDSPGYSCTRKACERFGRPIIANPTADEFARLCGWVTVLNVAGNRMRTNPGAAAAVKIAFRSLEERLGYIQGLLR